MFMRSNEKMIFPPNFSKFPIFCRVESLLSPGKKLHYPLQSLSPSQRNGNFSSSPKHLLYIIGFQVKKMFYFFDNICKKKFLSFCQNFSKFWNFSKFLKCQDFTTSPVCKMFCNENFSKFLIFSKSRNFSKSRKIIFWSMKKKSSFLMQ